MIAHIFFNMPFAARSFLAALEAVPGESWRLASQLGMNSRQIFRLIEWPALKGSMGSVAALVFMLCFASFAITLTLGGGPRWASLEAAIYQALRYDFDLGRAAVLALLQLAISGALLLGLHRLSAGAGCPGIGRPSAARYGGAGRAAFDAGVSLAALYVGLPVVSVVIAGPTGSLGGVLASPADMAGRGHRPGGRIVGELLGNIRRAADDCGSGRLSRAGPSPVHRLAAAGRLAPGAGRRPVRPAAPPRRTLEMGLGLVALINGLMGMPYVVRVVAPAFAMPQRHDRLCASLGIAGWNRWRLIDWPLLRRPVGLAMALVAALSLGDLGAIACSARPTPRPCRC